MSQNYAIAASHLALAGTGIYFLSGRYTKDTLLTLPVGTYTVIIINSIVGFFRWGFDKGDDFSKMYDFTKFLRTILAMPCFAGQMWISGGYQKEIGYLHPGLSLVPLVTYFSDNKRNDLVELVVAVNLASCGVVSFLSGNNSAIAATLIYALNHYLVCEQEDLKGIPSPALCNLILCAFTYLVHKALGGKNII